jgi:hypothetical protein
MDESRPPDLKDDILKGIHAIADFIGEDFWRTQRLCTKKAIPAAKMQGRWIASKRVLRAHYQRLTAGEVA